MPGQYFLDDKTYATLLERLSRQNFTGTSADLRSDILRFYSDPAAPYTTKSDRTAWARVQDELQRLRNTQPASGAAEAP